MNQDYYVTTSVDKCDNFSTLTIEIFECSSSANLNIPEIELIAKFEDCLKYVRQTYNIKQAVDLKPGYCQWELTDRTAW